MKHSLFYSQNYGGLTLEWHVIGTLLGAQRIDPNAGVVRCKVNSKGTHSSITDSIRNDAHRIDIGAHSDHCTCTCFNLLGLVHYQAATPAANASILYSFYYYLFNIFSKVQVRAYKLST